MQIVSTLCDPCHTVGRDTPAVEAVIVSVNKRATELDVCQEHRDEIDARLEDLFEVGRRPGNINLNVGNGKASKTKEGDFACDRCTRSFPSLQGLSMHRSRTHKVLSTTPEATRKRLVKAALAGELPNGMSHDEASDMLDRGECIFDETHGPFHGRSNVATHIRKMHGVSITDLGLANPTGMAAHVNYKVNHSE
jgi:hypothetical protein